MKSLLYKFAVLSAFVVLHSAAHAHFIWATVEPGSLLRLEVAESPGESVVPLLAKRIPDLERKMLGTLKAVESGKAVVGPLTSKAGAAGVHLLYGLHESSLIEWSAKGIADLDSAGKAIGLPAEILVSHTENEVFATVLWNGKPAAGATVEIFMPGSKEGKTVKSDELGRVTLQPDHSAHGLFAIGALVVEPVPGKYKSESYKDKWHMTSLTLRL